MSELAAKKAPGFLKNSVIYQINLRAFTLDGTLKAAERMLPHLASIGVDIVYLCPVTLADDDPREEFWSDRQRQSGLGNPKNLYRIGDYYAVDPEFGTNEDLKSFAGTAHGLKMRVILDLVYYHCGPSAVFIPEHPDFVVRNPDGTVKNGHWHFPELNFESPALREYLWKNMEYFVRNFDVDGYRCDVAGAVPLDFWEEGRRRIEALKPDVVMLSETFGAETPEQRAAFDMSYGGGSRALSDALLGKRLFKAVRDDWEEKAAKALPGSRFLCGFDNHDLANDQYEKRIERISSPEKIEAALVLSFALDGVPFLYNGQEIADSRRHSIFGNRFFGKNLVIDWSNAVTPAGERRMKFLKELIAFRRAHSALTEGKLVWTDNDAPDALLTFRRGSGGEKLSVAVNFGSESRTVPGKGGAVLLKSAGAGLNKAGETVLPPSGFVIRNHML